MTKAIKDTPEPVLVPYEGKKDTDYWPVSQKTDA